MNGVPCRGILGLTRSAHQTCQSTLIVRTQGRTGRASWSMRTDALRLSKTHDAFVFPTTKPFLVFQPDIPHTTPPEPCNHTCQAKWSGRAVSSLALARQADLQAPALELDAVTATPERTVSTDLFGYNLELTRHGMFAGLSAQLLANRLFASPSGRWPPARWEGIGAPRLEEPGLSGTAGTFATRCTVGGGHAHTCGIRQREILGGFNSALGGGSSISLLAGRAYMIRLVMRSTADAADRALQIKLLLTNQEAPGENVATFQWEASAKQGSETWQTRMFNFTSSVTTRSTILEVTGQHAGKGKLLIRFWVGAVSLIPSDNIHGARRDVLKLLQQISFRGPVRWPGGCYSSVAAAWEEGLRPIDERAPVLAPPETHFCNAVPGGLQAYTDGFTENWPSIDEYMSLIRLLQATPAVGLQVQFGSDAEVANARSFVEYCNGPASSSMGRLRKDRGQPEPYNIKIWYLGNEIGVQGRFPPGLRHGEWGGAVGAATAHEYAGILSRIIPALLAVDSSLQLVAANACPNVSVYFALNEKLAATWNPPYLQAVGQHIWAHSHHYYMRQPRTWTPETMTMIGKAPHSNALASLQIFRDLLDASSSHPAPITLDEWALGPPWSTHIFGTPHAIYGVSLLTLLVRNAWRLRLRSANYYAPINEGAITVGPWNSSLTPLGQAFELLARHQGGRLVAIPAEWSSRTDDDIEVLATVVSALVVDKSTAAVDGRSEVLLITAINRNAEAARALDMRVLGMEAHSHSLPGSILLESTYLSSVGIGPVDSKQIGDPGRFMKRRRSLSAHVRETHANASPWRGWFGTPSGVADATVTFKLEIPAYSVVQITVPLMVP